MRTAYKCRAYPAPEQTAVLNRTFGCVRKLWNQVLDWRTKRARYPRSFAVDTDDPEPLPQTGDQIGVDLGIKDFAVTSDGQRLANPRHLERKQRNLARYERCEARKCRGSANRKKAARKVAAAHGKVRRGREDFPHKTSTELCRRYDVIVVEDLNVSGMVKNRELAEHISDCGWGTFRVMLEHKALRWGRRLVVIDYVRRTGASRTRSAVKQEAPRSDPGRTTGEWQ